MSGFHDIELPMKFALGAAGGPEWKTHVTQLASGKEFRSGQWSGSRRRWEVGGAVHSHEDLEALTAFFEARRGRLHSFRFRDVTDWKSCSLEDEISPIDQKIGVGNGEETKFSLCKAYHSGFQAISRKISKPVTETIRIAIDGQEITQGWAFDADLSLVVFDEAPVAGVNIHAGFEYDLHARFDTDILAVSLDHLNAGRVVSAPIIELID